MLRYSSESSPSRRRERALADHRERCSAAHDTWRLTPNTDYLVVVALTGLGSKYDEKPSALDDGNDVWYVRAHVVGSTKLDREMSRSARLPAAVYDAFCVDVLSAQIETSSAEWTSYT